MADYADVADGVCVNVILLDPADEAEIAPYLAPDILVNIDGLDPQPWIGWTYDQATNTWTPPAEPPTDEGAPPA